MTSSAGRRLRLGDLLRAVGPRHPDHARRWLAAAVAVPTVTYIGQAFATNGSINPVEFVTGVILVGVCVALVRLRADRTIGLCVAGPLIGAGAIVVLDLATQDAGVTGQIFFFVPVLYAGIHLRVPGVVLVTALTVVGEAVVVFSLLTGMQAALEFVYMAAALTLMAAVMARSGVVQDRLVEQLRRQAAIDPLTGLVTRRVLDDATRSAISGAFADQGTTLVIIDLDRFKTINDNFGHLVGDDALSHVAAILSGHCRSQDVVARMGGDELAVLMPGCAYESGLERAQVFVDAVQRTPLVMLDGGIAELSISAGVAHAPDHAIGPRDLYATADNALYLAKRAGRGRVGVVPDIGLPTPETVVPRVPGQRANRS